MPGDEETTLEVAGNGIAPVSSGPPRWLFSAADGSRVGSGAPSPPTRCRADKLTGKLTGTETGDRDSGGIQIGDRVIDGQESRPTYTTRYGLWMNTSRMEIRHALLTTGSIESSNWEG